MSKLTPEQMARLGMTERDVPRFTERGWSRDDFKKALAKEGFTFASFERAVGLPVGSVNQSMNRRFPKCDRILSKMVQVPLHELWPNRYLVSGTSINYRFRPETMTDDELAKLNADVAKTMNKKTVVVSLPPGVLSGS